MMEETLRVFSIKDADNGVIKCYGCGWRVHRLYVLANSKEEALKLYENGAAGLCGDCFSEMLSELNRPLTISGGGLIEVSSDG